MKRGNRTGSIVKFEYKKGIKPSAPPIKMNVKPLVVMVGNKGEITSPLLNS